MAGFKFEFRMSGGEPTIQTLYFKDTETLTKGDLVNVESGEADLAAAGDAAILGAAQETKVGTDSVTQIDVIVDSDAVYSFEDNNARNIGDALDLSGTTGEQTADTTAGSNKELVVYSNSSATERTLVFLNVGKHPHRKAV